MNDRFSDSKTFSLVGCWFRFYFCCLSSSAFPVYSSGGRALCVDCVVKSFFIVWWSDDQDSSSMTTNRLRETLPLCSFPLPFPLWKWLHLFGFTGNFFSAVPLVAWAFSCCWLYVLFLNIPFVTFVDCILCDYFSIPKLTIKIWVFDAMFTWQVGRFRSPSLPTHQFIQRVMPVLHHLGLILFLQQNLFMIQTHFWGTSLTQTSVWHPSMGYT